MINWIFLALCLLLLSQAGLPQAAGQEKATPPANTEEGRLSSRLMGRELPYRVVLPVRYAETKDRRYPVIYLLHGLTGHYDNWTNLSKLAKYAAAFDTIIVTPEGENGWYSDHSSKA